MTSRATSSATSLPASAAGHSRSGGRCGQTIDLFGPEVVPASLSPSRENRRGLRIVATSGPSSGALSPSDALQRSLENRLRVHLTGSDLCEVIWKAWATPWGPCLSKPRARVRTTSATGSGLWATIRASDGEKGSPNQSFSSGSGQPLPAQAAASWPTPTTRDHKDGQSCRNVPVNGLLGRMVWPTPRASEAGPDFAKATRSKTGMALPAVAALTAPWPTPTATHRVRDEGTLAKCAAFRKRNANQNTVPLYLAEVAQAATYPTPSASGFEARDPVRLLERRQECKERTNNGNGFGLTLGQFATLENTNGPPEQTERRGALNPEFVCWLMGFPAEWVSCGVSAMQSILALPRPSSKRRTKP